MARSFWEPHRVVEDDPEPRRHHPSPLPDELRHRHDVRPLVEILADLIPHRYVGDTENGESEVKHQRPTEKVDEVVDHPIAFVQLPHGHVGDAHQDGTNENVLPAPAPFGPGIVRYEAHDRVSNGIENPWKKLNNAPQKGRKPQILNKNDDKDPQGSGEHLIRQHAKTKGNLLSERNY